jgi:hypothetical protein
MEASLDNNIERWLAEGTPEAAAHLDELARTTESKADRKAARRALYLLSQRGVAPAAIAAVETPAATPAPAAESMQVWASAFDGAGNRLFFLVLAGSDGGSVTVAQLLGNDELGLRDLTVERRRSRDIHALMERLEGRIDEGLAVAEIEADYARWLIERFRALNFQRTTMTPNGFLDLLPRLGASRGDYVVPPVYEHLSVVDAAAEGVPKDPVDLFKHPWFEPWFYAVEEVTPWLERWMEADSSLIVGAEKLAEPRKSAIATEAAAVLVSDRMRRLYVTRLEETADVLRRRGRTREALQALFHAQTMKSDTPTEEVPFAVAIAARTLEAAAEIVAEARAERAADSGDTGA